MTEDRQEGAAPVADGTIVSRLIIGARCGPELERKLAEDAGNADAVASFCVFETTASRGAQTRRVLCCWSGGTVDRDHGVLFTPIGLAAFEALSKLPTCMDEHPMEKPSLIVREVKLGKTPLREKVIDAVLAAPPGGRLCFLGELSGELDGHMSPAFNFADSPAIVMDEEGNPQ